MKWNSGLPQICQGPIVLLILLFLIAPLLGCGGGESGSGDDTTPGRAFAMGFTPWPYAATIAAVDDTYTKIHAHGDMVVHHIDSGVPWPEAYAQVAYGNHLENELTGRVAATDPGKRVYLAVGPLTTGRNAPANYWSTDINLPRPAPWDGYTFGDDQMAVAYANFVLDLIHRFDPDYCNYGIEITDYILNNPDPADVDDLFGFLQQVYDTVKARHPDLPLFVSAALKSPDSPDMDVLRGYADRISACTDIIGASTYGYIFYSSTYSGNPADLPVDWLSQARSLAPGKPLAVAETGWIAEDLAIPFYGVSVTSNPQWQADYVELLLSEAQRLDARFVAWFCVVDFDTLWNDTLGQDPLAHIWRDIGLYDQNVDARPALQEWGAWLTRPLQ